MKELLGARLVKPLSEYPTWRPAGVTIFSSRGSGLLGMCRRRAATVSN